MTMASIVESVIVPSFYMIIILLFLLAILYIIRRFFFKPLRIGWQRMRIKSRFKKKELRDDYLLWVNEKVKKGWRYLDIRKNGYIFFSKKEVPELLYTYMMIQKTKGGKQ